MLLCLKNTLINQQNMNDITKTPLMAWIICLVIFFFSLYVGGIQNGPFNENPSLIKSIALTSLLVSFVVGVLAFFYFCTDL